MKSLLNYILLCMTIKLSAVDVPQLFFIGDSTARNGDGIETWGVGFTDAHTHTSRSGAEMDAGIVADSLRQNSKTGMEQYLRVDPTHAQPTRFALNVSAVEPGSLLVGEADTYREERGFGYVSLEDRLSDQQCFAVAAEDGNYRVEIEFGDAERDSSTIIRAEGRRLMLEPVVTQAGEFVRRTIILNVRQRTLAVLPKNAPGGEQVVMGNKEASGPTWDNRLFLIIGGDAPSVRAISIQKETAVPTVFLIGDSTVTDRIEPPYASWGQILPLFFDDGVAIANHAKSGATIKSFISDLRLAKVLEKMREGDYLFIQFAHNDQKTFRPQTYVEAQTTYKAYLRVMIAEARLRGATPVLVTSMERAKFNEAGKIQRSLAGYPAAMRELAEEQGVPLIDLEPMSIAFYEALGPDLINHAFAYGDKDRTHHNTYGAHQLAKCVISILAQTNLPLAQHIRPIEFTHNPSQPDSIDAFNSVYRSSP